MDELGVGLAQCDAVGFFHRRSVQLPQAALDLLARPAAVGPPAAASANTTTHDRCKRTVRRLQQLPLRPRVAKVICAVYGTLGHSRRNMPWRWCRKKLLGDDENLRVEKCLVQRAMAI